MTRSINRRTFLSLAAATAAQGCARGLGVRRTSARRQPLNLLLITTDDLNFNHLGVTRCPLPGISPRTDSLAAEGLRFENAHVSIAICQPSRSVIMTGLYPHRNGALGFDPVRRDVPTLVERLRQAGYYQGILCKSEHLTPPEKFLWDRVLASRELTRGRDAEGFRRATESFLVEAKAARKPFFLMANAQDPHRPFAGSAAARRFAEPAPPRVYRPEDVPVPGFLPDLPQVRVELAQYFTSAARADASVGAVLDALAASGLAENTLVVYLSDNGMAFPYAKTNCYESSTRTPLIVRWPGRVAAGRVEREAFVSGVDLAPTLLSALALPPMPECDGSSFLSLLEGKRGERRQRVFTFMNRTAARESFPMRAIRTPQHRYIFNAWADGKTEFRNESQSGLTWRAMVAAAEKDAEVARRVHFYSYRAPEELYVLDDDPWELCNRIEDPSLAATRDGLRAELLEMMRRTADPVRAQFETTFSQR